MKKVNEGRACSVLGRVWLSFEVGGLVCTSNMYSMLILLNNLMCIQVSIRVHLSCTKNVSLFKQSLLTCRSKSMFIKCFQKHVSCPHFDTVLKLNYSSTICGWLYTWQNDWLFAWIEAIDVEVTLVQIECFFNHNSFNKLTRVSCFSAVHKHSPRVTCYRLSRSTRKDKYS